MSAWVREELSASGPLKKTQPDGERGKINVCIREEKLLRHCDSKRSLETRSTSLAENNLRPSIFQQALWRFSDYFVSSYEHRQ